MDSLQLALNRFEQLVDRLRCRVGRRPIISYVRRHAVTCVVVHCSPRSPITTDPTKLATYTYKTDKGEHPPAPRSSIVLFVRDVTMTVTCGCDCDLV